MSILLGAAFSASVPCAPRDGHAISLALRAHEPGDVARPGLKATQVLALSPDAVDRVSAENTQSHGGQCNESPAEFCRLWPSRSSRVGLRRRRQGQHHPVAAVGPMTGQCASFGDADEERRRNGRRGHQRSRRRARQDSSMLSSRRRRLRSEAGGGGRQPDGRQGREARCRTLLLRLVDPGLRTSIPTPTSCRSRRPRPIRSSPTSGPDPTSIRVCGRDDQQGGVAGNYPGRPISPTRTSPSSTTRPPTARASPTRPGNNERARQQAEALDESITAGEKDYSALVTKLKQAKIDVLYFGGYHTEAGLIVRQMRDQGMKTILMSRRRAGHAASSGRSPATPAKAR